MTIGNLAAILEELDQSKEILVEITKEDGEATATYDVGFGYSESGDFALTVHA